jgi:type II secretion system protein E
MILSEILVHKGLLTADQLQEALALQQEEGLRLDKALMQLGLLTERQLLQVMGEHLDLPVVSLSEITIDPETLQTLPPKFVYRKRLVPISRHNGTLDVATSDAFDMYAFDEIRMMTGLNIRPVLASGEEIEKVIKAHYGVGGDTVEEMVDTDRVELESSAAESTEDLLEMAREANVIKLVNEIIVEAVNQRASDIHVEPFEHELSIRYRIDGVLQNASVPPQIHRFKAAIISRIKIMASLNIAEKRLPQDGRIKFQCGGREFDVRVSVIPMLFGEGIVMRLLDKASVLFTLPQLGMDPETFNSFQRLIERPYGIILVTGPTGSGKTTTLYAGLNAIVGPEIKVLTVEDPVEYHLKGVNQIPVESRVGMTFERGLRAILRHDPDVVMIGEIRDQETARAATQAALTGHLVLSTLHTNDACSAPTRLVNMGVEPFLVSSTLIGAMAQRLVRKICLECKAPWRPHEVPADFNLDSAERLYHGPGCATCHNTGYWGRTGLYELMLMNEAVSDCIMRRAPTLEIIRAAREAGLRLLREDGWMKVRQGVTTIEEVVKSTAL